jgi:hypothetical protein
MTTKEGLRITATVEKGPPMTAKIVTLADRDDGPEQRALVDAMFLSYPGLRAVCYEAGVVPVIEKKTGKRVRLEGLPAAAGTTPVYDRELYAPDPDFCWEQKFSAPVRERGEDGLVHLIKGSGVPPEHFDVAEQMVRQCRRP